MQSNYKPIGDYVQLVDERNKDLKIDTLLGVNLDKKFMPSVANTVGTDLTKYKIIRKGQFGCKLMSVGRDKCLPISRLESHEEAIISSAYFVFEVIDETKLLAEYLMMWFQRSESDRYLWFQSGGDIRGRITWNELCTLPINVPSPRKQNEIVKEYNTIKNRIVLNNQLIQKLEEAVQAIYKQWFVDFEFPNENGKPYKSSSGKMVWNEELEKEIPKGWKAKPFTDVVNFGGGGTPSTAIPEYWNGDIPFYTPADLNGNYYCGATIKSITKLGLEKCSSKLYPKNTIFLTARGATVGGVTMASIPMAMNQTCYAIWGNENSKYFAHQLTLRTIYRLKNEAIGATFEALVTKDFNEYYVIAPSEKIVSFYDSRVCSIYEMILNRISENDKLTELSTLLLSKLATIEN